MAYNYNINTSKKDNKAFVGLQICHVMMGIISLFLSTFFVSSIYNPNDTIFEYVIKASQYEFFHYLTMLLTYTLVSKIVDKTNRIWAYRFSILFRTVLLLLVIIFGINFSDKVILVGVLVGFSSSLYYSSYNVLRQEMVNRNSSRKFAIIYNVFNQIINITIPILMGALIDAATYKNAAIYILVVSITIMVASFFVRARRPEDSSFNLKEYFATLKQNPELSKKIKLVYLFCLVYGCNTIAGTLLNVMVMVQFGSNFSFGAVNSVFAIVSILTVLFVGRFTLEGKRTWLYLVNTIGPFIGVILYTFMPNVITLFVYYFVYAIGKVVAKARLEVVRNQNLKEAGLYEYISEHQSMVENCLNLARILTFGLMIALATLNNFVVYQVFFVIYSLSIVFSSLFMLFYERKFYKQQNKTE